MTWSRLIELSRLFLKLGIIGFGGPAAHIALMRQEVVERRGWLSEQEFLDLLSATNLIPGPNSTEMAIHIGHRRAGRAGLIVAGLSFIVPAVAIVSGVAWTYLHFRSTPQLRVLMTGVTAVILAIVAQAIWALGRTALKTPWLAVLGLSGVVAASQGIHELLVLASGALASLVASRLSREPQEASVSGLGLGVGALRGQPAVALAGVAGATTASIVTLGKLFLVFLKAGGLLFGSGYVLLAFLRADLVDRLGWLTEQQLLDAIAVGQVTPGPVFTTATFVGYVLAGPAGATVATIGIFAPAFVYVALSAPVAARLRQSPAMAAALDGINAMSVALMVVVTWRLAATTLTDPVAIVLTLSSAVLLMVFRVNSMWLIAMGAGVALLRAAL